MTAKRNWKKIAASLIVMTALAAVPLIYSSILTHANIDPTGHLDTVPAAVVNSDAGAADPDGERVEIGDELTGTLLDSEDDNNFAWREMSADDAAQSLEDGEVYAVLSIPREFSDRVVSVGDDPSAASAAKLSVTTNDGLNMISGNIASTIGDAVTDALRADVSGQYLEKVYLGFTDVHASIADAADGATRIADGAGAASEGSGELVVGLDQLSDGTGELAGGAAELAAGAESAADGASTLNGGLDELRTATAELPDQAGALDDGAHQVAAGARTLSDEVDAAVARLSPAIEEANGVAAQVSATLHDVDALADEAGDIAGGLDQAVSGAEGVKGGLGELGADLDGVGASGTDVQRTVGDLLANYASMTDDERRAALERIQDGADGVVSGIGDARTGVENIRGDADKAAAASDLRTRAGELRDGLDGMGARAGHLGDDFDAAAARLDDRLGRLDAAVDGVHRLSDGADRVAAGTAQLAQQAGPLADGIAQASDGAGRLASGTGQLADGARTLAGGAGAAASGAQRAESGAVTLDDGLGDLADGSGDLRDGLVEGAGEVPSYTDSEAAHLGEVSAEQVAIDDHRINEVAGYGAGLAPYFLSLALWVGGMSFYMMAAAINARGLARRLPAPLLSLRSLLPGTIMGLVQAAVAVTSLHFWVGVEASDLPGLFVLAAFASVTFLAVNQALVSLLGSPGRFVALLMVVLQVASAGGTYPIETTPEFYQVIHGILPMTYTVEGFRSLIAGGDIGVGAAYLALAIWLAAALAMSLVAAVIALRRERRAEGVEEISASGPRRSSAETAAPAAPAPTGGPASEPVAETALLETAVLEREGASAPGADAMPEPVPEAAEATAGGDEPTPAATRETPVAAVVPADTGAACADGGARPDGGDAETEGAEEIDEAEGAASAPAQTEAGHDEEAPDAGAADHPAGAASSAAPTDR